MPGVGLPCVPEERHPPVGPTASREPGRLEFEAERRRRFSSSQRGPHIPRGRPR